MTLKDAYILVQFALITVFEKLARVEELQFGHCLSGSSEMSRRYMWVLTSCFWWTNRHLSILFCHPVAIGVPQAERSTLILYKQWVPFFFFVDRLIYITVPCVVPRKASCFLRIDRNAAIANHSQVR